MGKYKIEYDKLLNPAQYEAVITQEGPILVIAGAGSGKTRTLTYRVARLVEDGIPPASILLLTFTRKASNEMLQRAAALLDKRCAKVSGGTFHSFAAGILRRYASRIDFVPGFTILDRSDSESIVESIRREKNLNQRERKFPRKSTIVTIFSKAVNKSVSLKKILSKEFDHLEHEYKALKEVREAYIKYKKDHHSMDYDDLLVYLKILLEKNDDVRKNLSLKYKYIMVDEYQDTNLVQSDIVRLLTDQHKNIMVVGDDAQSIYAFRGANYKNIMQFPDMFEGTKIIKLEENYRSVQPILNLTNNMIEQASERYTKELFTSKKGGSKPRLINMQQESAQSRFVIKMIEKLRKKQKQSINDMAVLFRAGFHSFDLEVKLAEENIPYVKYGGFKFLDKAHIKDVLAFLRVIAHPNDRISWQRIVTDLEGIGPKTAMNICDHIDKENSGYHALETIKSKAKWVGKLKPLISLFKGLDFYDPEKSKSLSKIGEVLVKYYEPLAKKNFDDFPKRMQDLERLVELMDQYSDLEKFLTAVTLEPPSNSSGDNLDTKDDINTERLTLSTIHSAKGLEWKTVFIIWATEGRFPPFYSIQSDNEDEMEEELRLMYVAATRAKERLYILSPGLYNRMADMYMEEPTRFLAGISNKILPVTEV